MASGPHRRGDAAPGAPTRRWYLLIHRLPPKPAYLRAKISNRLARVGGVALKNSVYVLPERDDCLEDLQWIAQEAAGGGGGAYVCRAEFLEGVSDDALRERFRSQVSESFEALKTEMTHALHESRRGGGTSGEELSGVLLRLKKRFDEMSSIDFFAAPAGREAETMLRAIEARAHGRGRAEPPALVKRRSDLVGRTWVTRRDPHVDRLASAWLIRRFMDPGARFRFVDPRKARIRAGEIGFDLVGGEFTHEGDRCTFETLLLRLGIADPALREIGEIVHDIDLKDAKFGRPDAAGVHRLMEGLIQGQPKDEHRLTSGLALFDHLYASFRGRARFREGATSRPRKGAKRTR